MDLRSLIPAAESVAAPLAAVLGDGGGGLSGLATLVSSRDLAGSASALGTLLQERFDRALPAAGAGPTAAAAGALGGLSGLVQAVPADLLVGVQQPLADLDRVLGRLPEILGTLERVAAAVEGARGGQLAPVLQLAGDALGQVASRATGSDFAQFNDWIAYLRELGAAIAPVIAAGGTPDELRERLLDLALARARETIAGLAPGLTAVLGEVTPVLGDLLPALPAPGLPGLRDAALQALQDLGEAAGEAGGDLATRLAAYRSRLFSLTDTLHGLLDQVESRSAHPLLTPGALGTLAGAEIDRVLAMQVSDFSNVQARLEAFYAGIEDALRRVDLTPVTGQISGFFADVQAALAGLDPGAISAELDGLGAEAERLVAQLETVLSSVTARIQGWLEELRGQLDGVLAGLGAFDADGRFRFFFQDEIEGLFARMDALIQGDPEHPGEFSVRGALHELQAGLVQFIEQVEGALVALAGELESARGGLAGALEEVRAGIESVDPSAVMDQARAGLERAFQEIGDLDLDALLDPVVRELEEARDALAQVDVSELNELLRAALREVLDAIATSDFDRELTRPLLRELDELLEGPRELLASFAGKLTELLDRVAAISPRSLLAPLQAELDRITGALDVDLQALLEPPLGQALGAVRRQLGRLDPAPLLAPVTGACAGLGGALDTLAPQALLAPAQAQLDALAGRVGGLDLDRQLAPVNAVFGDIGRFLDEIDPARLLRPLSEPFASARATLDSLRPGTLLAPLADVMGQLGDLTGSVPESVAVQARGLFDEAMARIDALDPQGVLATVSTALAGLRTRLEAAGAPALLHALQLAYGPVRTAVQAADARDGTAFAAELAAFEPTRAFGPVITRYDRCAARIRAVIDALDPAPLQARYQQARARIDELLPRAIRDDITASQIQTLLSLASPAQLVTRLDAGYQRIVDQLLVIDPGLLLGPLVTAHGSLRTLLSTLDLGALTGRIRALLARLAGVVGGISLQALAAPVLEGVDALKAVVRALDPTALVAGLQARFTGLLDLLDEVSVRALVTALQQSWDQVAGRIRSLFDLDTLLEPLDAILEQIQALLGGLDLGELVAVIQDKIDGLRDELEEALNRTGDAFKSMLAAVPL